MRSNISESLNQSQQKQSANRRLKEAEEKTEALLAKNAELEERAAALSAELLEAREKLQRAEYTVLGENELLRSVLSQAGVTVFNEGKDLKINWMLNPFPNFSDPDPEGKTEAEVMPLPDAVYIMDLKREVIESGVGSRTDIWLHVGGDLCYYDYVVEPIRDGSGVVCGVLGSAVDITERKKIFDALRQAEGALRRSERQLLQALEAAQMVAWEWDPETGEVAQRSSLPPSWVDPLSGEDFLSLIHPEDVEQFVQKIQTAYKEKSYFVDEFRVRAHQGEYRWVEGRGRVVQKAEEQKEQVEGLAIDITERKLNEQVLQEYASQLEQANKNLNEFASIASHDLQEPLRKIRKFGDLLVQHLDGDLDPEVVDFAARMTSAADRMDVMIRNVLTLSQVSVQELNLTSVDLSQTIKEVVGDLEVRIQQTQGKVEAGDLPVIRGDALQLHQLFQNLVGNGLKYHREGMPPVVQVWAEYPSKGKINLVVKDNGIGFDEQDLERIFQPFQRLHGRGEYDGTGMGLAICRKIVERHGGCILAKSSPGEGSTFIVTLPLRR